MDKVILGLGVWFWEFMQVNSGHALLLWIARCSSSCLSRHFKWVGQALQVCLCKRDVISTYLCTVPRCANSAKFKYSNHFAKMPKAYLQDLRWRAI